MINRISNIPEQTPTSIDKHSTIDFNKIVIDRNGRLEDIVLDLKTLKSINSSYANKEAVLRAIDGLDYSTLTEMSNFFYRTSGIYNRLCKYLATLYRFDWMVTPHLTNKSTVDEKTKKKYTDTFYEVLEFLDNFKVKKTLGEIALKVVKNGCYYGYIVRNGKRAAIQELPVEYCRTRFISQDTLMPVIEFNMKFFDDKFKDENYKLRILSTFPPEFKKGYAMYKRGELPGDYSGDTRGWYLLDVNNAIKFNLNDEDFPALISTIPSLIDLDEMQAVDRKKLQQQLMKLVIQKVPMDKNGDILFDSDEVRAMHSTATKMVGTGTGAKVFTTFSEVEVADMGSNANNNAADDTMKRVKAAVFDQGGVAEMLFNTDGNIALEKSILNDEAAMYNLIQQFEAFLNFLITPYNKNKKYYYTVQILNTTNSNYRELSKMFKEQTQLGYSKMLAQIALGQSQSSILANAYFENEVLDLSSLFIPPMSSNTMSNKNAGSGKAGSNASVKGEGEVGRPQKANDEKSTKTIQNQESLS